MNELDIQLIVNPACELVAVDRTSYQNLHYNYGGELQYLRDRSKHVSIEFLTDVDGEVMYDTVNFEKGLRNRGELLDGNTSVFYFPKDGTFTYYKFLIPSLMHMVKNDSDTNDEMIRVKDQLYYSEEDNKFFYGKFVEEEVDIRDFSNLGLAFDYVISKSIEVGINEL